MSAFTTHTGRDMAVLEQDNQLLKEKFKECFSKLPLEALEDLVELLQQFKKEQDPQIRFEIIETIQEIAMPDSLLVEMRKEFELGKEDSQVREKLSCYRVKVGDQIRTQRKRLGLSQEILAESAGISQSHICRLETGVHVPTFETISKIAQALSIDPSKLDPGFSTP